MKKVCLLAICFVFLFQAVAFAETKIGVFDAKKVMQECLYGKDVKAKLDAKFGARGEQLKKERQALEKLKMQIESKAFDEKAQQDKILELRRRSRDWSEDFQVYQKSIQQSQVKLGQPVLKKLEKVVLDYCTANGYSIAFDRQAPGLAFVGDGLDITSALIKELDKMKKAGK